MLFKDICDLCIVEWAEIYSYLMSSSGPGEMDTIELMVKKYNKDWNKKGKVTCPPGCLPDNVKDTFIFDHPPCKCPFKENHGKKLEEYMKRKARDDKKKFKNRGNS